MGLIPEDPLSSLRLEHFGLFGAGLFVFGLFWRWMAKHLEELHAKFNGFTIDKKGERKDPQ